MSNVPTSPEYFALLKHFDNLAVTVSGSPQLWCKLPSYSESENIPIANNLDDLQFLANMSPDEKSRLLVIHAIRVAEQVWHATQPNALPNPGLIISYWTSDVQEFGCVWPLITYLPDQSDLDRSCADIEDAPATVRHIDTWTKLYQRTLRFVTVWAEDKAGGYLITSILDRPVRN